MSAMNCLSFWFPSLEATGVPVPKTEYFRTNVDLIHLMDGKKPDGYEGFLETLKIMGRNIGYPIFLRTGWTGAKHSWKDSCFVEREEDLYQHVNEIVEFSLMCDLAGLPTNMWVVREMLPTEAAFNAFWGDMPITRERRYFIDGGEVIHRIPYWPLEAFESSRNLPENWQQLLEEISHQSDEEISELTDLSLKVAKRFKSAWSVDWLLTKNGWYATDMARAEDSYGCPDALKKEWGRAS